MALSLAKTRADLVNVEQSNPKTETVYNPSHKWIEQEYSGCSHFIPPDLNGASVVHPRDGNVVAADGCLVVKDTYGRGRHHLTKDLLPFGPAQAMSAFDIAMFLVEKLSARGVFKLMHDGLDEDRKVLAKKELANYNKRLAEDLVRARAAYAVKWAQENPGTRVPPATRDQKWAQKFVDELADAGENARGRYSCEFECMDTNDFTEYARHMRVAHNMVMEPPKEPKATLVEPPITAPATPHSSIAPIKTSRG